MWNWLIIVVFIIFGNLIIVSSGQNLPSSPCPNIFRYTYERSAWFGVAQIRSPAPSGKPIKLVVYLSLKVPLSSEYIGSLELLDTRQESLQNLRKNRPIRYRIRFPSTLPVPRVTKIVLNNWIVCHGPPETGFYVTEIRLEHTLYTPAPAQQVLGDIDDDNATVIKEDITNNITDDEEDDDVDDFLVDSMIDQQNDPFVELLDQPLQQIYTPWQIIPMPQIPNYVPAVPQIYPDSDLSTIPETFHRDQKPNGEICGRPFFQLAHFLVGGQDVAQGSWPWLVAIFINRLPGPEYICGGTLVSEKVIVTAAHCVMINDRRRIPNEILVSLGRYSNTRWGGAKSVEKIESIIMHNDFQRNDHMFDADIAVLIVRSRIQYTKFVRPICLLDDQSKKQNASDDIDHIEGSIVIWSKESNENFASIKPQIIDIPIVSDERCIKDQSEYVASNRTFCAGGQEGRGPCYGDSGSGMAIRKNGQWFLRGIVSGGLSNPTCANGNYVVFTDVTKFINFIKPYTLL